MAVEINNQSKILQHMGPKERFTPRRADDDISRHSLAIVHKQAESIGTLYDAAIRQFQGHSSGRFYPHRQSYLRRYPSPRSSGVDQEFNLLLPAWVPDVCYGELQK
ncbi:MAG: hypothetical protein HY766_01660 [candidate division NC10 bacterium]|nr:hypothetical protein [candidate division NC10 bacterium]